MTTVLIFSVLSFVILLFTAVWLRRQSFPQSEKTIVPVQLQRPRALFAEADEIAAQRLQLELRSESQQSQRCSLLARAEQGDLSALLEAHASNDAELYRETLNVLVALASGATDAAERLPMLASYIVRSQTLRGSRELAAEMISLWQQSPHKQTLDDLLRIAALADDPTTYRLAVEAAIEKWRDGSLKDVSATYLLALCESEFHVIASESRQAGARVALKKVLSNVRRQLAATNDQQR